MAKKTDDLEAVRTVTTALGNFSPEDQERIIRWARERLGLAPAPRNLPETSAPHVLSVPVLPPPAQPADRTQPPASPRDLKSFVTAKNPKSDIQFAATVAYFYRFEASPEQRSNEIDSTTLQDACRLAGRKRFKHPRMTLTNAKNHGLLDMAGEGRYAINTVGENLVAMTLPGQSHGSTKAKKPNEPRKRTRNK